MNWQAVVERTVTGLGYDLVDCERTAQGLLRVFIDRLPGSSPEFVLIEDCEKVTRQLQQVLEVENCSYERLEVSSPGLDRPLKTVAHYERFVGEQVEVTLRHPFEGRRKFRGVLEALPAAAPAPGGEAVSSSSTQPEEASVPAAAAGSQWRLVFADGKTEHSLDFSLEEVRETRLVPVLDFKGRRFLPPAPPEAGEVDGEGDASGADKHGGQEQ